MIFLVSLLCSNICLAVARKKMALLKWPLTVIMTIRHVMIKSHINEAIRQMNA